MRSARVTPNTVATPNDYNALLNDATGASQLLAHQMYGTIALPTNPTSGQTLTLDINGTNVVIHFVSVIGSTAGNVLIGASATATLANLIQLLLNPTISNSTQVAIGVNTSVNVTLVNYINWSLSGTSLVTSSYNSTLYAPATSFSASTTVTGGSYTANTMALYVEPGVAYVGGTRVIFAGGVTPTVTAPVSHPRIDVLAVDNTGTLSWTTGTENASPVAPTYPTGKVAIIELYNVVSETALLDNANQTSAQGYILNDVRPLLGSAVNLLAIPSNLIPDAASTRDLGSSGDPWRFIFADGSQLTNIVTAFTSATLPAAEAIAAQAALAIGYYQASPGALFDAKAIFTTTGSSVSDAFTVGSNSNRVLVVMITASTSSAGAVTSVKYGGVSMTAIDAANTNGVNGIYTFYLIAPATGSNNLTYSVSSSVSSQVAIYSFYNAAQTSAVIDSHNVSSVNTSTPSLSLTNVNPLVFVIGFAGNGGSTAPTGGGNVDSENTQNIGNGTGAACSADSGAVSLPGTTMTFSASGGNNNLYGVALVSIAPFNPAVVAFQNASSASVNMRMKSFAGFATAAQATPGASVQCATAGIVSGFSGLVPGSQYYLNDTNGTIGTSVGTQTRKAGISIDSTHILITNIW